LAFTRNSAASRWVWSASYAEVPVMPRWWAVALLLGVTVPGRSA
jgi:hypothetical protein